MLLSYRKPEKKKNITILTYLESVICKIKGDVDRIAFTCNCSKTQKNNGKTK